MKRISEDVRRQVLEGSLIRAMLIIAVPVVVNSMIQTCYNLTDTFWLGRVGTDALAAINLVTPVQNIVINFGSGISVAGSVLISQLLGILVTLAVVIVGGLAIGFAVKAIYEGSLRVSETDEARGLDVAAHGESAYPAYLGLD